MSMPKLSKAKIAKMKALLGDFDAKALQREIPVDTPVMRSLHMEDTLNVLEMPAKPMITKTCKRANCQEPFMTGYRSVAYCSDECRRLDLHQVYGIDVVDSFFRGKSGEEIWGGRVPPFIVPGDALRVMKYLVEKAEESLGQPIEPWQPPTSPTALDGKKNHETQKSSVSLSEEAQQRLQSLGDILNLPPLEELS